MKSFQQISEDAKSRIHEISADELWQKLRGHEDEAARDWVLIDVRENDEFRAGHMPGARGIGRGVLEYHIQDEVPEPNREIVLYCRGGNRSALAADSLQNMGYTNVHSLSGGWKEWTQDPARPISNEGEPIQH
jgi:rhodanese-related sulfurtransferase